MALQKQCDSSSQVSRYMMIYVIHDICVYIKYIYRIHGLFDFYIFAQPTISMPQMGYQGRAQSTERPPWLTMMRAVGGLARDFWPKSSCGKITRWLVGWLGKNGLWDNF